MAKAKYVVYRYFGIPVEQNNSGQYQFKQDAHHEIKIHTWRTGKHTKGHFKANGQLFLTENDLLVAIIDREKMAFKDRHEEVPLQRFTSETINEQQIQDAQKLLQRND
jgi:hypothetical protein